MKCQFSVPVAHIRLISWSILVLCVLLIVACTPNSKHLAEQSAADASASGTDLSLATYVGKETCMDCHQNAETHYSRTMHGRAFELNPRGEQQAQVCEACHGPGSLHAIETWNKA